MRLYETSRNVARLVSLTELLQSNRPDYLAVLDMIHVAVELTAGFAVNSAKV